MTCIKFKWSRRKCMCVKCNFPVCKEEIKLETGIPICTSINKQFPADNQQKCITSCQVSYKKQMKHKQLPCGIKTRSTHTSGLQTKYGTG